jgi:pimeloyl-ACP methyl ester carboxylesterase
MLGLQRGLRGPAHQQGVSVWGLRYRARGWNGGAGPQADARWALDKVLREFGPVPVALLGHSMGARVAVHVAGARHVVGVTALAPWFPDDTPIGPLTGRHLVAAHGRRDKITSYDATREYVARAGRVTASARFVDMGGLGHYLIRGRSAWHETATRAALGMLAPPP